MKTFIEEKLITIELSILALKKAEQGSLGSVVSTYSPTSCAYSATSPPYSPAPDLSVSDDESQAHHKKPRITGDKSEPQELIVGTPRSFYGLETS